MTQQPVVRPPPRQIPQGSVRGEIGQLAPLPQGTQKRPKEEELPEEEAPPPASSAAALQGATAENVPMSTSAKITEEGEASGIYVVGLVAMAIGMAVLVASALAMAAGMSGVRSGATVGMLASLVGLPMLLSGLIACLSGALFGAAKRPSNTEEAL